MKSGELIHLLQKVDPDGKCHIRTSGGAVYDVEKNLAIGMECIDI